MFSDGSLRTSKQVAPKDFAGRYAFYDDGWLGTLSLSHEGGRELLAAYHSYRFGDDYEATAVLDERLPNKITITIQEFNEMSRQVFTGYLFTRSKNVIAGWTEWKGVPYGFIARKARPTLLAPPQLRGVEPRDFAGQYNVYCDGQSATLTLRQTGSQTLAGTLSEYEGVDLSVIAEVDSEVPHKIVTTVSGTRGESGGPPVITAFLFSWSRDVIAGTIDWGETHLGCYAVKFSDA